MYWDQDLENEAKENVSSFYLFRLQCAEINELENAQKQCNVRDEPACDHKMFVWLDEWEIHGSHRLLPSFAALYRPIFTQKSGRLEK